MVDLRVIRNNLNMLAIFKHNKHYIKFIYDDFIGSDMTFEKFVEICNKCWSNDYGFIVKNLTLKPNEGKYMNNFEAISL